MLSWWQWTDGKKLVSRLQELGHEAVAASLLQVSTLLQVRDWLRC
jgi:hypothetical protein